MNKVTFMLFNLIFIIIFQYTFGIVIQTFKEIFMRELSEIG